MSVSKPSLRASLKATAALLLVFPSAFLLAQEGDQRPPADESGYAEEGERTDDYEERFRPKPPRGPGRPQRPPEAPVIRAAPGWRGDGERYVDPYLGNGAQRGRRVDAPIWTTRTVTITDAADRRARELAAKYRQTGEETEKEELRDKLVELTEQTFEKRLEGRREELERMRKRLDEVAEQLERREELRDQIIDRRVKDLLDEPDVLDWDMDSQLRFPAAISGDSVRRQGPPRGMGGFGPRGPRFGRGFRGPRRFDDEKVYRRDGGEDAEEREREELERAEREEIEERERGERGRGEDESGERERESLRRGLDRVLEGLADELGEEAREGARKQLESVRDQLKSLQERLER